MLLVASGLVEPTWSTVFLFRSPSAVIKRTAARFFSDTLGASSAGSYQDDEGVARAFLGAIDGKLKGLGESGVSGSEGKERGSRARRRKAVKANAARASLFSVGQLLRKRGEAETPTSNQPPRVNQGRRLLGPTTLRTCPLASP